MTTTPTSRRTGLILLIVGSVLFLVLGCSFERSSPVALVDFKTVYYGARCLLHHCDPYNVSELERFYLADGGERQSDQARVRQIVVLYVYLPTSLTLMYPFALLPWGPAHLLWMAMTAGSFILAAFLMWDVGSEHAPTMSGGVLCLLLAGSEMLLEIGNTAGIVVSFCAIASWCLLRSRFVPAAIFLFSISLLVKPHDAGLIWLFFFLAGGTQRKRAIQILVVTAVLALPAVLETWHGSPHWFQEMHGNMLTITAHGNLNDPGPAGVNPRLHGAMIVSLQTVFSLFRDQPGFYNTITYLLCAPLLLAWLTVTFRKRLSISQSWLALATIASLSMVPIYHRQHDTRLLLLIVPACALLWSERGPIRWFALVISFAGVLLTGDIPLQVLAMLAGHLGISSATLSGQFLTLILERPAPLALLTMGTFFLWAYLRSVYRHAPIPVPACHVDPSFVPQNAHSTPSEA